MPVFVIPSSLGAGSLREVNRCHGKGKGHPCTGETDRDTSPVGTFTFRTPPAGRKVSVKCSRRYANRLVYRGKVERGTFDDGYIRNEIPGCGLQEANACHVPGGSSAGGQFATKGSAGCQPQGELSFGPKPGLTTIDNSADSGAVETVFEGESVRQIAKDLVKDFPLALSCEISSEGGEPDYEAYRDSYNEWRDERIAEHHDRYVEGKYEEWSNKYGDKSSQLETAYDEVRDFVRGMNPANTDGHLPVHQLTFEETARIWALAGLDESSVDGFEIDAEHEKALTDFLAKQYPGQEVTMRYYDEGMAQDFYSDYTDFDTWYGDHSNDEGDDLASFEDWVADIEDVPSSGDAKVTFSYHSTDPEMPFVMQREFSNDGGLKVEHNLMEVDGRTPGGMAKLMMRNAALTYERLGIEEVEVHSGLSVGGYAWPRYGFAPDSPGNIVGQMSRRLEREVGSQSRTKPMEFYYDDRSFDPKTGERQTRRITTRLDPAQVSAVEKLISKYQTSGDVRYFWALNDAHVNGTEMRNGVPVPTRFSIGKMLMLGTGYSATLYLNNDAARKRLHEHTGLP
jgi:hypothetical protein